MDSWHHSQQHPESPSHGTGSPGPLEPGSQISHFALQSSACPSPLQVSQGIHPEGTTTLSLRDQVPGISSAISLTRVMSPRTVQSDHDPSVGAHIELTRVMSPTNVQSRNPVSDSSFQMIAANQTVLLGQQCICPVCENNTPDPSLCAQCGAFGHPQCIGTEYFQGYAFCQRCYQQVVTHFASLEDALLRGQWNRSLQGQVTTWRERARDAIGVSASIGIASNCRSSSHHCWSGVRRCSRHLSRSFISYLRWWYADSFACTNADSSVCTTDSRSIFFHGYRSPIPFYW